MSSTVDHPAVTEPGDDEREPAAEPVSVHAVELGKATSLDKATRAKDSLRTRRVHALRDMPAF
jgi:hypothetical protein